MFTTSGLFRQISCSAPKCTRVNCPFSHVPVKPLAFPADELTFLANSQQSHRPPTVIGKRAPSPSSTPIDPRPTKLQRIESAGGSVVASSIPSSSSGSSRKPTAGVPTPFPTSPSASQTAKTVAYGPPKLVANPAESKIPYATRQAMITNLYGVFKDLYHNFHEAYPSLAHNDAIAQEAEVYAKTNKVSYKNAMISCIASVKKRPVPDSPEHPSVGAEAARAQRNLMQNNVPAPFTLTLEDVEPLIMNEETMRSHDVPMEVPPTPGGDQPSAYGEEKKCDRCGENSVIVHDRNLHACLFHWGRAMSVTTGGEKVKGREYMAAVLHLIHPRQDVRRVQEKNIEELHSRHAFTASSSIEKETVLDIAVIDCEGVYTTQGMSVARVSVCSSDGKVVFDELIRPDDGVEVIDFNTRFSGVTSLEKAVLDLKGIRRALDVLIGLQTVVIGHGVENDLMMLRMVHHRLVDTVALFPHRSGLPYRRALRILAKEYLNRSIQTGDAAVGHSSSEDALATLDLVKYYVQDQKKKKKAA